MKDKLTHLTYKELKSKKDKLKKLSKDKDGRENLSTLMRNITSDYLKKK